MQKKILILALDNIHNTGDELLGVTTKYLVQTLTSFPTEAASLTFSARQGFFEKKGMKIGVLLFVCLRFLAIMCQRIEGGMTLSFHLNRWAYRAKLFRYYKNMMKEAQALIISGGMLKFGTQNLTYVYDVLTEYATKYNVPVMFNAQSIQFPNQQDLRFHYLVKICNRTCVKMITTRDGVEGLKRLRDYYVHTPITITDYVGDPALWTPQCFLIHKQPSNMVGINLIRHNIYKDYGTDFSNENLMEVYHQLVQELDRRQIPWQFFCNGMPEDYKFGQELMKNLNIPEEKLLPPPANSRQLAEMLCGFKAVFGARLHACITSFALDIPIVGLLWDDKLKYFAQTMGISHFFLDAHELTGTIIADRLQEAEKFTVNRENRNSYKEKTRQAIKNFLEKYVNS